MSQGLQQLQALLLGQPQRRIGWAARAAAAPAPPAEKQEASASPARTEPGFAGALELEEFQPKRFRLAKPLYFKVIGGFPGAFPLWQAGPEAAEKCGALARVLDVSAVLEVPAGFVPTSLEYLPPNAGNPKTVILSDYLFSLAREIPEEPVPGTEGPSVSLEGRQALRSAIDTLVKQAEFFEWSDPAKAAVQAEDDEGPSPAEADSLIKPMTL